MAMLPTISTANHRVMEMIISAGADRWEEWSGGHDSLFKPRKYHSQGGREDGRNSLWVCKKRNSLTPVLPSMRPPVVKPRVLSNVSDTPPPERAPHIKGAR